MAIYRFKVTFENYEDVWREIDIRSDQTFEDFFHAIQQSIGFDYQHEASFYISNDQWKLGQQISSASEKKDAIALKDAVLLDWVNDPHQKIYYTYDPKSDWTFYIELVRILMKEDITINYPACVKVNGDSPVQYLRQPAPAIEDSEDADKLVNDLLKGMHISDEEPQDYQEATSDEEEVSMSDRVHDDDGFSMEDEEDSDNEQAMDEDDDQREY
jgi:hypothetical protein